MQDGCDEGLQLLSPISCLQIALDPIGTASIGLALPAMRMLDQNLSGSSQAWQPTQSGSLV